MVLVSIRWFWFRFHSIPLRKTRCCGTCPWDSECAPFGFDSDCDWIPTRSFESPNDFLLVAVEIFMRLLCCWFPMDSLWFSYGLEGSNGFLMIFLWFWLRFHWIRLQITNNVLEKKPCASERIPFGFGWNYYWIATMSFESDKGS